MSKPPPDDFSSRSKAPPFTRVPRVKPEESPHTPAEKAPDPDLGWAPIDHRRYISREFMQLEWERMWSKVWLLGARELDMPEPGDFTVTEVGRESIIMIRQRDGRIRAYYNVCQHRGNRLRPCGLGTTGASLTFKCQYHHWEYELDGSYHRIPDLDTFPQGCPPKGLMEVRCDTWGSFVWFCLDEKAPPLLEFLDPLPRHLDPYNFHKMAPTRDITVEWDCNWKTSVDAFNESYHVQGIHPQLLWYLHDLDIQIDCYERHSRYLIPFGIVSPRIRKPPAIPEPIKLIMKAAGMDPADYDEPISSIRGDVQKHKRANGPAQGKDYSRLNDDQLTDDYHYLIFPNLSLNVHADDLWIFRQRPHPTDPDKMYYDILTFDLVPDGKEWPARPEHKQFKHSDKSIGLVLDQDSQNLPSVQAGMHSKGFRGIWAGQQELRIRHFHKVLDDYVYGPGGKPARSTLMSHDRELLLRAYRQMKTIREFEERLHVEIATGAIPGFTHLYAGQEAIAVGVCQQLTDADYIVSTHRGHGHCIAKGCDVIGMMKEIYGRSDGLCKGKGGSMHIADVTKGMLGANAIVGGGPPLAVGAAIACKVRGNRNVSVAFGGDGSSNQGTVFEAMNLAVVLKAPAIFVIEDNGYAEHTGTSYAVGSRDIAGRARGFGMAAERVDGADFFAVYEAMGRAVERARRGEGPSTIEATITRYFGHFEGDPQNYRAKDEVARLRETMDCLKRFRASVEPQRAVSSSELDAIDREVLELIEQAVVQAKAAPLPAEAELITDVYISY